MSSTCPISVHDYKIIRNSVPTERWGMGESGRIYIIITIIVHDNFTA